MRRALALGWVLLSACGQPLVGPEFVGTPQLTLGGVVLQASPRIPASHGELALSVFWIGTATSAASAVEQEGHLDSGLAEYSMILFDAPTEAARGFTRLLPGGSLAIGVIALYADRDASGSLDLELDLLLGASAQHLVVFASADVEASTPAGALLGPIAAGYHVYQHDRESSCRFVNAADCAGDGAMVAAPDPGAVTLTLWGQPEDVVVPAPRLEPGSIWSPQP